ncbi:MAG: amidohydrolase family protein, partial [Acidimicrobiaceae bacterium]|nr:amidohydrolase family protein [Acidimicrobiaceae bacterium]
MSSAEVVVIRGGQVVSTSGATAADVIVEGERIAAVVAPGSVAALAAARDARVIDADGCYVVPGGVDVHVHLQLPMSPEATSSDTFATGTVAAAWGGTTTVIDFAGQMKGMHVRDAVEQRLAEADGQCAIDYGLHLSMGGVDETALKEMGTLVEEGITSFKFFMAYPGVYYSDDGQLLQAFQRCTELGSMAMMHAENGIAIDVLRDQAASRGDTGSVWHGRTRPS